MTTLSTTQRHKQIWLCFICLISLLIVLAWRAVNRPLPVETEDFFYLADIIESTTRGIQTETKQIMALTDWLSINVKSTLDYPGWHKDFIYPAWFDGSSTAAIIRGGIGNCGYQAENILTLAQYLGITELRKYYVEHETGSRYIHAFSEIKVDGEWGVFDPNMLGYVLDKQGRPLSLAELVWGQARIHHKQFARIAHELRTRPEVLRISPIKNAYLPLGSSSYSLFRLYGEFPLRMYFHLRNTPLQILILALIPGVTAYFLFRKTWSREC